MIFVAGMVLLELIMEKILIVMGLMRMAQILKNPSQMVLFYLIYQI